MFYCLSIDDNKSTDADLLARHRNARRNDHPLAGDNLSMCFSLSLSAFAGVCSQIAAAASTTMPSVKEQEKGGELWSICYVFDDSFPTRRFSPRRRFSLRKASAQHHKKNCIIRSIRNRLLRFVHGVLVFACAEYLIFQLHFQVVVAVFISQPLFLLLLQIRKLQQRHR